jgi:hypothetical protein
MHPVTVVKICPKFPHVVGLYKMTLIHVDVLFSLSLVKRPSTINYLDYSLFYRDYPHSYRDEPAWSILFHVLCGGVFAFVFYDSVFGPKVDACTTSGIEDFFARLCAACFLGFLGFVFCKNKTIKLEVVRRNRREWARALMTAPRLYHYPILKHEPAVLLLAEESGEERGRTEQFILWCFRSHVGFGVIDPDPFKILPTVDDKVMVAHAILVIKLLVTDPGPMLIYEENDAMLEVWEDFVREISGSRAVSLRLDNNAYNGAWMDAWVWDEFVVVTSNLNFYTHFKPRCHIAFFRGTP